VTTEGEVRRRAIIEESLKALSQPMGFTKTTISGLLPEALKD